MVKLVRGNSKNDDFISLVKDLDAYLKITDGNEHQFYNQFNSIDNLNHVVILYDDKQSAACGAFKAFNKESVEVKRMYTRPEYRNRGFAEQILKELERWAKEIGYTHAVLETGIRQKEAVRFYKKLEYNIIPNYGQYKGIENSLCFKKELKIYEKG